MAALGRLKLWNNPALLAVDCILEIKRKRLLETSAKNAFFNSVVTGISDLTAEFMK